MLWSSCAGVTGVFQLSVLQDGPAHKAGVPHGSWLVELNGISVKNWTTAQLNQKVLATQLALRFMNCQSLTFSPTLPYLYDGRLELSTKRRLIAQGTTKSPLLVGRSPGTHCGPRGLHIWLWKIVQLHKTFLCLVFSAPEEGVSNSFLCLDWIKSMILD